MLLILMVIRCLFRLGLDFDFDFLSVFEFELFSEIDG